MRIVVTGGNGMLGRDLCSIMCEDNETIGLDLEDTDITQAEKIMSAILPLKPDIVIHAAAFTDVDGSEEEPEKAFLINEAGTANVVKACQEVGCPIVYLSTDFVFNGNKKGPYRETDKPDPLNVYGKSKLAGEKCVATLRNFFIIRTAWLFGRWGRNFVTAILEKANTDNVLRVVDDQIGSPTYTVDLSRMLAELIQTTSFGIYHICNEGNCSRFDFAREIVNKANIKHVEISPIKSSDLPTAARRPANSALDNFNLRKKQFGNMRRWEVALEEFLKKACSILDGSI